MLNVGCIFLPQSARLRPGAPDLRSSPRTTRHSTRPLSHCTPVSCPFSRKRFVSASQGQPLRVFVCPRLWKRVRPSFFCRLPFQGPLSLRSFAFTAHSPQQYHYPTSGADTGSRPNAVSITTFLSRPTSYSCASRHHTRAQSTGTNGAHRVPLASRHHRDSRHLAKFAPTLTLKSQTRA